MTAARIKAADFLNVSSRSTAAEWAEVDRLEKLLLAVQRDALEHAASLYVPNGNPEIFRNRIIKAIEAL